MKDLKGNQLYSLLFLTCINEKVIEHQAGDLFFQYDFKKDILFYTVYEERLLRYLKERRPDMVIIDRENISGKNEAVFKEKGPTIDKDAAVEIAINYLRLER